MRDHSSVESSWRIKHQNKFSIQTSARYDWFIPLETRNHLSQDVPERTKPKTTCHRQTFVNIQESLPNRTDLNIAHNRSNLLEPLNRNATELTIVLCSRTALMRSNI